MSHGFDRLDISTARQLAKPLHVLTDDIIDMYDTLIRGAISNGQLRVNLKFQNAGDAYRDMIGFPSGMTPARGLGLLKAHYESAGFNVSDVQTYGGDMRDPWESFYSYIEVWGW